MIGLSRIHHRKYSSDLHAKRAKTQWNTIEIYTHEHTVMNAVDAFLYMGDQTQKTETNSCGPTSLAVPIQSDP